MQFIFSFVPSDSFYKRFFIVILYVALYCGIMLDILAILNFVKRTNFKNFN